MHVGVSDPVGRRTAARAPWGVLVLIVLLHVVGCAHGPLPTGASRIDTLGFVASAPVSVAETATARSDGCGSHDQDRRTCTGTDGPALPQAERGPGLLPAPAVLDAVAAPGPAPLRGPTVRRVPRSVSGTDALAVLQAWRN